jgi:hypothetical protein
MDNVLGGIAKHTKVLSHCKCTAIAVMGINASSGAAYPLYGSKSSSISQKATFNFGESTLR